MVLLHAMIGSVGAYGLLLLVRCGYFGLGSNAVRKKNRSTVWARESSGTEINFWRGRFYFSKEPTLPQFLVGKQATARWLSSSSLKEIHKKWQIKLQTRFALFQLTYLTVVSVEFWLTNAAVPTGNAGALIIVMTWRAHTSVDNCCVERNLQAGISFI